MTDIRSVDDPRLNDRRFSFEEGRDRPRSISKAHRELLGTFTKPIHDRIGNMPDDELWAFIAACQSVSQTNCGWDAFAIAKTFLDSACWEMKRRIAIATEA